MEMNVSGGESRGDKYRRAAWESQLQLRNVFPVSNPAQLVLPIFGVDEHRR